MNFFYCALIACVAAFAAAEKQQAGEVVLITGASSGIGYAVAKVLAKSGYRIVATARRMKKLEGLGNEIESEGGVAAAYSLDVTKEHDYVGAFAFAEGRFGGVDHVFLNAGYESKMVNDFAALDTADFDRLSNINFRGVLIGMKHSIIALRKRGGGSIITCSSAAGGITRALFTGAFGDFTHFAPYSATKAAIDQLVRAGIYYKNENIRFYGLKPNVYWSEMVDRYIDPEGETAGKVFQGS